MGAPNLRSFHLGVDLGQRRDHTAFVLLEQRVEVTAQRDAVTYEYVRERRIVAHLVQRWPLGKSFREIVEGIAALSHCECYAGGGFTTCVDATGMGLVVTEDLRRARPRGELYPVVITGGQEGAYRDGFYTTPRTELLLGVLREFEQGGICVARGVTGWDALEEEMRGMRRRNGLKGLKFEGDGRHDDLVFALALALFGLRMRPLPVEGAAVRFRKGLGAW